MAQIDRLKLRLTDVIIDTETEQLLEDFLECAKIDILQRRYPFLDIVDDTPLEYVYQPLQVELALIRYNMLGVEGQSQHSENDIDRVYENTLLNKVTPKVKVI